MPKKNRRDNLRQENTRSGKTGEARGKRSFGHRPEGNSGSGNGNRKYGDGPRGNGNRNHEKRNGGTSRGFSSRNGGGQRRGDRRNTPAGGRRPAGDFPMPVNGRELALLVLHDIWENGAYTAIALNQARKKYPLDPQERRFATELVNGAVKAKGTLEWLMRQKLSERQPVEKLEPMVRNILYLGMYQIFFLERIPDSAACNESVNLAKKYSHRGVDKFVNGVLRNAVRDKERLAEFGGFGDPDNPDITGKMAWLSLKEYHPLWLIQRWVKKFGLAETERLCRWDNEPAPLSLRVNTLETGRDQVLAGLEELGAEAEPSRWSPDGIVCTRIPGLAPLFGKFPKGFYVQDESSMLPAAVLAPRPGEKVLDMCSAPGGKTTHMAALMGDRGDITACDIYPHKLELIRENAERLGLECIWPELQDGTRFRPEWYRKFDRVLVDAPCSGLGVLRRRAEARWTKSPKDLEEFPPLQRRILDCATRYVKEGGWLLYSTCTMEDRENALLVKGFLQDHPEWEQAEFTHPITGKPVRELQLYPQRDGVDGFYLTLLHLKGE